MKRLLLVPALAIAVMLFATRVYGGTLHVFAENLGVDATPASKFVKVVVSPTPFAAGDPLPAK